MTRFINKTVIITGAASGIGAAATKRFSDEGANVVAIDLDQAKIDKSIKELPAARTIGQVGDTTKMEDAVAAVRTARAMALDHGKDGIRVNAVNPTYTDTGMTQGLGRNEAALAGLTA